MSLRVASALVLGLLLGCASQSTLMSLHDMTDENLISYYHDTEADLVTTQQELETLSKNSRYLLAATKQDKLNDLKKRKYRIQHEFDRRRLPIPETKTPDGEGRY